jgi:hypothetical protein
MFLHFKCRPGVLPDRNKDIWREKTRINLDIYVWPSKIPHVLQEPNPFKILIICEIYVNTVDFPGLWSMFIVLWCLYAVAQCALVGNL